MGFLFQCYLCHMCNLGDRELDKKYEWILIFWGRFSLDELWSRYPGTVSFNV